MESIPIKFLAKWRRLLNLAADTFDVPAALIMRLNESTIEVLVASENSANPYQEGATEHLNSGLYCETVLETSDELQVVDALRDSDWDHNPDLSLGMVHYLGMPLFWPDGSKFGTLCVLDTRARDHARGQQSLLRQFKEQIESEFRLIEFEQGLIDSNDHLGLLVEQRTAELRAEMAQRLKLEQSLRQAQKMESLSVLAGGVAHDLNNILSGVVSYPDTLLAQLGDAHPMSDALLTIRDSGLRAASVVDDLLAVARPHPKTKEQVNVNEIVDDYLSSSEGIALQTANRQIKISTALEAGVPYIDSLPISVTKCLANLLHHSVEMLVAGGELLISSCCKRLGDQSSIPLQAGSYVVLSVGDNGPELPLAEQQRIFEPYYTTKELGHTGSGLGLTAVWNILADHGGHAVVESTSAGTVFNLYFPASELVMDESGRHDNLEDGNQRILVVDDEPSQRDVLGAMLEVLGYAVTTAGSGDEALALMRKERFALLVLDMAMPGLNGHETYAAALRIEPQQKAIVSSGLLEPDDVRIATALGISTFLRKPYKLAELAAAIQSNLPVKQTAAPMPL